MLLSCICISTRRLIILLIAEERYLVPEFWLGASIPSSRDIICRTSLGGCSLPSCAPRHCFYPRASVEGVRASESVAQPPVQHIISTRGSSLGIVSPQKSPVLLQQRLHLPSPTQTATAPSDRCVFGHLSTASLCGLAS